MSSAFEHDPYPGRPRILFVGFGTSSHTHSWIDLLGESTFNVRLFALPTLDLPPDDWRVRTYVSGVPTGLLDRSVRRALNPRGRLGWGVRHLRSALGGGYDRVVGGWLEKIARRWRPDIVHSLGLDPAGFLVHELIDRLPGPLRPIWVAQVRGGPDLALHRFLPGLEVKILGVLGACDQLLADNAENYQIATAMGLPPERVSELGVVPGTGGVDVPPRPSDTAPSRRERTIVWPKAYDCPQSYALPVLEAIRVAWSELEPCRIHLLATSRDTRMWLATLPAAIRESCVIHGRIPRREVLELLPQARVMLAPSVSDGVPNTLYEAMVCGAFPIVSPLATIASVVRSGRNVLFARNLYPEEIADALGKAMGDDSLVDAAAAANYDLVRQIADRASIGPRVAAYYERLAARGRTRPSGAE